MRRVTTATLSTLAGGFAAFALICSGELCLAQGKSPQDDKSAPSPAAAPAVSAPPAAAKQEGERPNGSLWSKGKHALAEDIKASRVGDTITIIVQESSTASSTANTQTSRSDSANFSGTGIVHGLLKDFGAGASNSTNGQGLTNRTGSLVTQLTVVVKEVLPNGNLMVEGTRVIGVNAEKQKIVISGMIRPADIGPNNTVSSIALANASIQYDGKGPVGDRQKRGLLATIFHWLF